MTADLDRWARDYPPGTTTDPAQWIGPAPAQWAPAMLTWLRDTHPQIWAGALMVASTGSELAAPKRGRKPA